MSLWTRIMARFAQPDPLDVESTQFHDSTPPIPDGWFIPGPAAYPPPPKPGEPDGKPNPNDKR